MTAMSPFSPFIQFTHPFDRDEIEEYVLLAEADHNPAHAAYVRSQLEAHLLCDCCPHYED